MQRKGTVRKTWRRANSAHRHSSRCRRRARFILALIKPCRIMVDTRWPMPVSWRDARPTKGSAGTMAAMAVAALAVTPAAPASPSPVILAYKQR